MKRPPLHQMRTPPPVAAKPARSDEPLSVEVELTIDDWTRGILHATRDVLAKNRRHILTIFLPAFWLAMLFIGVLRWMDEDGKKDAAAFLHDVISLLSTPFGWLLVAAPVAIAVLVYLLNPWMMRRRVRRHLRDNGFDAEIPVVYRFDAAGIASSEPDRASRVPWSRIERMEGSEDHLFFVTSSSEEPIVLPKRGLSNADVMRVRQWGEACIGRVMTDEKAPPLEEETSEQAIRVSFILNAKDRAAAIIKQDNRPARQRRRIILFVLATLGLSLMVPIGFAIAWIMDHHRVPLAIAFPLYLEMIATEFWRSAWAWAMLMVPLFFVHLGIRRAGAHYMARELQAKANPDRIDMIIADSGIRAAQGSAFDRYSWACFKRIDETRNHIFLQVSRGSMLLLPRRVLDENMLVRFNTLAERHLASSSNGRKRK